MEIRIEGIGSLGTLAEVENRRLTKKFVKEIQGRYIDYLEKNDTTFEGHVDASARINICNSSIVKLTDKEIDNAYGTGVINAMIDLSK